jgi:exonuclease SbcC
MAIVSRLLKKIKRKPKTVAGRLVELDQLSMEALTVFATGGEDDAVRAAAIARLDYGVALTGLALNCSVSNLQQKAKQRIAELIDQGTINLEQLNTDGMNIMVQFTVVGFCKQPDLLPQLLSSSTDANFFYQVAMEGVSVRLRELAAEKIDNETLLKQLLKETKGKDKRVYSIAKQKCDKFRDRDRQTAQIQIEITGLCERLEAHSKRPFDKLFTAQAKHLIDQWQLLESQSPDTMSARAQQAVLVCQQTIDTHLQEKADSDAREAATANAADTQHGIIGKLGDLLATLYELSGTDEELKAIEQAHTEYQQQWINAVQYKLAKSADEKTYSLLNQGINFQLQQLAEHGSLAQQTALLIEAQAAANDPEDKENNKKKAAANAVLHRALQARLQTTTLLAAANISQSVTDARELLLAQEKQWAATKEVTKNITRHISAMIRKANTAIETGQSQQAAGVRRAIEEKLPELKKPPAHLLNQLEQLDVALEKLLDWKNYVVAPKKQQLIAQMQALVSSQENPEALATKIRRLQDEWKTLSKGSQDQELWESFHQLAQAAYQPCKDYFDEQAKIRQVNFEKRSNLVTQLNDYFSAQQWQGEGSEFIDWSAVEKLITTAIKEWRSYSPTERTANKPVQQNFDSALDAIRGKLNENLQQNAQLKQQLIDQVKQLTDQQDNRQAVEDVKRLQAQWKLAGLASRKDEQHLWKAFRAGCDAVFEKRQQLTVEFKAELEVNKNKALELQAEVEGLSELTGQPLLEAKTRVAECQQEFSAVGNLPKAKAQSLNQGFYKAIEQFDSRVSQQRKAAKEQVWLDLLEASNTIRLSQIAEDAGNKIALEHEARAFMDTVLQWPKNGLAALEKKIMLGKDDSNQQENEQALKVLCIRAEILTDKPTPAEDKSLRMQYQVSRLEQGLGQQIPDSKVEMKAMMLEWVAVGSVSTDIYSSLLERFQQCRQ